MLDNPEMGSGHVLLFKVCRIVSLIVAFAYARLSSYRLFFISLYVTTSRFVLSHIRS